MKYSDDCKVYRIRYYNVWFYLFAKTEMDEYKINILGEHIDMGDSMMMKDIHCWCTRQNIRYLFRELEINIEDPAFATFDFQGYGERQLGLLESVQTAYGMITRNEDFLIQAQQNTEQGMKMQ